jgi:uncharacterized protein YndB with AHSA1/START domain
MSSTKNGAPTSTGAEHREVRRFERRLRHRPEKVWRALTDARELAHWFPARVEGKPEPGAALRFVFPGGTEEPSAAGTITEWDPPRRLAYTMGRETLRWELTPLPGDGCLLVFTAEVALPSAPANDNGGAITNRLAA